MTHPRGESVWFESSARSDLTDHFNTLPDEHGQGDHAPPSSGHDLASKLADWWFSVADREVQAVVPKAVEYSAYDLVLIGRVMADTIGLSAGSLAVAATKAGRSVESVYTELGCYFYLLGKIGRMTGAFQEGRLPSDDTIHDINVYGRMIQRIRESGGWPE